MVCVKLLIHAGPAWKVLFKSRLILKGLCPEKGRMKTWMMMIMMTMIKVKWDLQGLPAKGCNGTYK